MARNSLELVDLRLARRVESEPPRRLRKVAAAVSRLALDRAGLARSPVFAAALRHLDAEEPLPAPLEEELARSAEDLDLRYLALLSEAEAGRVGHDAVLPRFREARAAAAVVFACHGDALKAATLSSYEAWAAIEEDTGLLRKAILTVLDEPDAGA